MMLRLALVIGFTDLMKESIINKKKRIMQYEFYE